MLTYKLRNLGSSTVRVKNFSDLSILIKYKIRFERINLLILSHQLQQRKLNFYWFSKRLQYYRVRILLPIGYVYLTRLAGHTNRILQRREKSLAQSFLSKGWSQKEIGREPLHPNKPMKEDYEGRNICFKVLQKY